MNWPVRKLLIRPVPSRGKKKQKNTDKLRSLLRQLPFGAASIGRAAITQAPEEPSQARLHAPQAGPQLCRVLLLLFVQGDVCVIPLKVISSSIGSESTTSFLVCAELSELGPPFFVVKLKKCP